jgi:hypothetical protein
MALLALSESLGRWAEAASKTTWVYVHPTQGKLADEVIRWLSDEGAADAASAQAILATYAPELREQLSQVAATRAQQLDEIRRVMAEDPPNPWLRDSSDLPKRLVESAADLKKAKRQLDAFIRATFPRPPTAVRD